jgi:hypothetical protein
MKKFVIIMVLVMTALAVNAQRTPVKVADLQKAIKDNIAANYGGFTIKDATKVVANNVTEFEVVITKGTTQETLLYANDGKFIKKVTAKEGTVAKTPAMSKTPEKPPVK